MADDFGATVSVHPTNETTSVGTRVDIFITGRPDDRTTVSVDPDYRPPAGLSSVPPGWTAGPNQEVYSVRCDTVGTYELELPVVVEIQQSPLSGVVSEVRVTNILRVTVTCTEKPPSDVGSGAATVEKLLGLPAGAIEAALVEMAVPAVAPARGETPGIPLEVRSGALLQVDVCAEAGPLCVPTTAIPDLFNACVAQRFMEGVTAIECGCLRPPVPAIELVAIVLMTMSQRLDSLGEGVQTNIAVTRDDGKNGNNNPPRIGLRNDMLSCLDHELATNYDDPPVVVDIDFTKEPWKTRTSDAIFLYGTDWFAAIDPNPKGLYGATVLSVRNGAQVAEDLGITAFGVPNDGGDKTCRMPVRPGPLVDLSSP